MNDQSVFCILGFKTKNKKKEIIYASLPEKLPLICICYADQSLTDIVFLLSLSGSLSSQIHRKAFPIWIMIFYQSVIYPRTSGPREFVSCKCPKDYIAEGVNHRWLFTKKCHRLRWLVPNQIWEIKMLYILNSYV